MSVISIIAGSGSSKLIRGPLAVCSKGAIFVMGWRSYLIPRFLRKFGNSSPVVSRFWFCVNGLLIGFG